MKNAIKNFACSKFDLHPTFLHYLIGTRRKKKLEKKLKIRIVKKSFVMDVDQSNSLKRCSSAPQINNILQEQMTTPVTEPTTIVAR